jgi:hypothetical protein
LVIARKRTRAQIRERVEHPFHVVKNLFRHRKDRNKGLAKNTAQLFSLFALTNLVIAREPVAPSLWKPSVVCMKNARNEAHPWVKLHRIGGASLRHPKFPHQRCQQLRGLID